MHQPSIAIHLYPVNEYRLVLRPPQAVRERLEKLKQNLKNRYQLSGTQLGYNHIQVAAFQQFASLEEKVQLRLRQAMAGVAPFRIQLYALQSLPAHSIYLEVPATESFQLMLRELKRHHWMLRMPMHQPYIVSQPKIMLSQKLSANLYEAMWPHLEKKHFTASFIAEDLLLLRRRQGEKNWQILDCMTFRNMPVLASQGVLF